MKRFIFTLIMIFLVPLVIAFAEDNAGVCNEGDKACFAHKNVKDRSEASLADLCPECRAPKNLCEKNGRNVACANNDGNALNTDSKAASKSEAADKNSRK